ncbi:MAG TPA: copper-translocating P-type ATPase, partial [Lentisphaeria bacterium]|nr:copper-translocating P-type ATPase [Lentisphaeria bacterium]
YLAAALIAAALLAYAAIHDMFTFKLPFPDLGRFDALVQIILLLPILLVGRDIFKTGFRQLARLTPNMDSLIALAAGAAILYSLMLLVMPHQGDDQQLYFDSAGMIIALILLGRHLENRSRRQASSAIRELMELAPATATLVDADNNEKSIGAAMIRVNDRLRVKPGERYPADGVVEEGHSTADESMISGESIPVEKSPGSTVTGAAINLDGTITMRATQIGENTVLARIIRLVAEAQSSRPPIARLADVISRYFVWGVLAVAGLSFLGWTLSGAGLETGLRHALAVLVIACPCALGLATPIALIVGIGRGAGFGILIKSGSALEAAGKIQTVIFDKTGTLTSGSPDFISLHTKPDGPFSEAELFAMVAAVEKQSNHPLGRAVVREAERRSLELPPTQDVQAEPGHGIQGRVKEHALLLGTQRYLAERGVLPGAWSPPACPGQSLIYVAVDGDLLALLAVVDQPRPDAAAAIDALHRMNIKTIMLTGDRRQVAAEIAAQIGIDDFRPQLLPSDKALIVQEIQKTEKTIVAMVGDGINDAPALSQADVGIAIGAGADVAIESADIVLTGKQLMDVAAAIALCRATLRVIKQNLFWALAFNAVGIPLAAGVFTALFDGPALRPVFAALAMACSSLAVVANALRLRRWCPPQP